MAGASHKRQALGNSRRADRSKPTGAHEQTHGKPPLPPSKGRATGSDVTGSASSARRSKTDRAAATGAPKRTDRAAATGAPRQTDRAAAGSRAQGVRSPAAPPSSAYPCIASVHLPPSSERCTAAAGGLHLSICHVCRLLHHVCLSTAAAALYSRPGSCVALPFHCMCLS
jgi:hypothetical protein